MQLQWLSTISNKRENKTGINSKMNCFQENLELNIRKECSTLSGWSHFAYRSYYIPLREVVDGSLCEMFFDLSLECQTNIANNMEREIDDIKKKIEDQRQRAL